MHDAFYSNKKRTMANYPLYRLFLINIFCIIVLAANSTWAKTTYIVGVEETNHFPLYDNDEGEYIGFSRELLDKFAKHANINFEYRAYPVERLFKLYLDTEQLDFKFPDSPAWRPTLKLSKTIFYSKPVIDYQLGIFVHQKLQDRRIDALNTVGIIRGFTPHPIKKYIKAGQIELIYSNTLTALLKMVHAQRVDAALVNVQVARYHLDNKLKLDPPLVFKNKMPSVSGQYHLSSRRHAKVLDMFDQYLEEQEAYIESLKQKYDLVGK